MTHFVLSRSGYDDLVNAFGRTPSPLWVNYGVLSETELSELRSQGIDVSDFTSLISRSNSAEFEDALNTIREHHPGSPVWVEHES